VQADELDAQFWQPLMFIEAEVARARGDLEKARSVVENGLADNPAMWLARYSWPPVWLGLRIEAEEHVGLRSRASVLAEQVAYFPVHRLEQLGVTDPTPARADQ
jgi:hypothetical protein